MQGQTVRYGTNGICRVEGIEKKVFGGQTMEYYVLKPVAQESATLYVPAGNAKLVSRMQRLLTAQEIHEVISSMDEENSLWIAEDVKRRETYTEILHTGDRKAMAGVIKTLFLRRQELALKRKKLHAADEKLLKEAERVLYEEFAYVLGISQDKVAEYILDKLGTQEKEVNG